MPQRASNQEIQGLNHEDDSLFRPVFSTSVLAQIDCPNGVSDELVQELLDGSDWVGAARLQSMNQSLDPDYAWADVVVRSGEVIKRRIEEKDKSALSFRFPVKTRLKTGSSYLMYLRLDDDGFIADDCSVIPIPEGPDNDSRFRKHMFRLAAIETVPVTKQVQEATVLIAQAKMRISEYYKNNGYLPSDNISLNWQASPQAYSGKYVDSIQVSQGAIVVQFGNSADSEIQNALLTLTPYEDPEADDQSLTWVCGYAEVPPDLQLAGSKSGFPTAPIQSTIKPIYLEPDCLEEGGSTLDSNEENLDSNP